METTDAAMSQATNCGNDCCFPEQTQLQKEHSLHFDF